MAGVLLAIETTTLASDHLGIDLELQGMWQTLVAVHLTGLSIA